MRLCVLLFALLMLPVGGQAIIGTIEKIDKDQVTIKGPDGSVTMRVDDKTTVRKGKASHDLTPLAVGDEIRANYYGEESKTAVSISAKITFSGTVTESSATHIIVRPNAGPEAERKDGVFVFLRSTTKYGSSRSQITTGKRVHIVGWDAGEGVVDAEKVAISEGDVPLKESALRP